MPSIEVRDAILIAEDQFLKRMALARIIKARFPGFEIYLAESGRKAKEIIERERDRLFILITGGEMGDDFFGEDIAHLAAEALVPHIVFYSARDPKPGLPDSVIIPEKVRPLTFLDNIESRI